MKKNAAIVLYVLVLSLASAWVVYDGAAAEPYISFRFSDAFVQVGVAVALMTLWLQFVLFLFYGVSTRRLAKAWLAVTLWAGIALFYLWVCPGGYISDVIKFVIEKQ